MKSSEKSSKEIRIYAILVLVIVLFVFTVTFTFLEINIKEGGISNVSNNYYDINLLNATIDYKTTTTIKLDNEENIINVKVDDLNNYINGNSINFELYNIGNIDAEINSVIIGNIDTNIDKNNIIIETSLKKGIVLNASEKKMFNIYIKSNSNDYNIGDYYNFIIKLSYKEIIK